MGPGINHFNMQFSYKLGVFRVSLYLHLPTAKKKMICLEENLSQHLGSPNSPCFCERFSCSSQQRRRFFATKKRPPVPCFQTHAATSVESFTKKKPREWQLLEKKRACSIRRLLFPKVNGDSLRQSPKVLLSQLQGRQKSR